MGTSKLTQTLLACLICAGLAQSDQPLRLEYSVQLTTATETRTDGHTQSGFRCKLEITELYSSKSVDDTELTLFSGEVSRCQALSRVGESAWIAHRPHEDHADSEEQRQADIEAFYGASNMFLFEKHSNGTVASVFLHPEDGPKPVFLYVDAMSKSFCKSFSRCLQQKRFFNSASDRFGF